MLPSHLEEKLIVSSDDCTYNHSCSSAIAFVIQKKSFIHELVHYGSYILMHMFLKKSFYLSLYCPSKNIKWFSNKNFLIMQKNWNLFSVNVAMAGTGLYQLTRKIK